MIDKCERDVAVEFGAVLDVGQNTYWLPNGFGASYQEDGLGIGGWFASRADDGTSVEPDGEPLHRTLREALEVAAGCAGMSQDWGIQTQDGKWVAAETFAGRANGLARRYATREAADEARAALELGGRYGHGLRCAPMD